VLVCISLVQVTLLFAIVRLWCGPPGSAAGQWAILALLAVVGTTLGLLISAFAETEDVAAALVPIAVMPQIILAGVIAPLKGLVALWLAWGTITVHAGELALEGTLPTPPRSDTSGVAGPLALVAGHAVVFAALAVAILWWRDQRPGKK
jgi:ABC-type multidrug transport system permease subunit